MITIDVLGTEYEVQFLDKQDEEMKEKNWTGVCEFYNKKIRILKNDRTEQTLIHEIVHAYMFESGIDIDTSFHTEECVDWIAIQFNKIMRSIVTAQGHENMADITVIIKNMVEMSENIRRMNNDI